MPTPEQVLLANPSRVRSIQQGVAQSKRGEGTRYESGHWTKVAAELEEDRPER